jgi:replicative DNA helicase
VKQNNPTTINVERSLIAAAMSGPEAVRFIAANLGNAQFADPECQAYWVILQRFEREALPFDLAAIADTMARAHGPDSIVGLVDLFQSRWEAEHVGFYCHKILEWHRLQDVQRLGARLSGDTEPDYDAYIADLHNLRQTSVSQITTAAQAVEEMQANRQTKAARHPTGITSLDRLLSGGIDDGQVCVIAGRPGSGKTVLMLQAAMGAMARGDRVLVVSLEMLQRELMERLSRGHSTMQLAALPLYFIDSTSDLQTILALCRVAHRQHGVRMIVIDYLQLLEMRGGRNSHREEQVAAASRAIKRLAMDLQVPVILGSQLNRAGAENPTLSSLRESGAIEQDASQVVLIAPPVDYGEQTKMILAKNRNGQPGEWRMTLDGPRYWFTEQVHNHDTIDEGFDL